MGDQHTSRKLAVVSMTAIFNSEKRYALAQQAMDTYESRFRQGGPAVIKKAIDLYFESLYTPTHLELDELIPGALQNLDMLTQQGYQVVLVSPLPESERKPITDWLEQSGILVASPTFTIPGYTWLILCSKALREDLHDWYFNPGGQDLQYKTKVTELLVNLWEANTLLYIDPEEKSCTAVGQGDYSSLVKPLLATHLEEWNRSPH